MPKILLIDDDVDLCEILQGFLKNNDIDVDFVNSGQDALRILSPEASRYDLLVLDIMMPGEDGLEFLKEIKSRSLNIPVIMLTGRADIQDKLTALDVGAEDYICKPCDPREILARIRTVLRRSGGEKSGDQNIINVEDIELNRSARTVHINQSAVYLTDVEFRILDKLLQNAGNPVSSNSLSIDVLERPYVPDDRSLSKHLSNLRQKIGTYPNGVERIRTLRGKGFRYNLLPLTK